MTFVVDCEVDGGLLVADGRTLETLSEADKLWVVEAGRVEKVGGRWRAELVEGGGHLTSSCASLEDDP